jgi:hypothetical protein
VFLCQNLVGYRHLTQLVTRSFLEGQQRGAPMLERAWLQPECAAGTDRAVRRPRGRHRPGFRARQGRGGGALSRALAGACAAIASISKCSAPAGPESRCTEAVLDMAQERGVPAVATNDVRFLTRPEFEAHEARVCIHDGAQLADTSRAAPLLRRAISQDAGGDGGALCRCAGAAAEHAGDRQALLAADQIGLFHAAGLSGAGRQHHRRVSCARSRSAGSRRADPGSAQQARRST